MTAAELMAKQFNPVRYVVPGYVAEGITLLAGAPKIGKSWMAMGLCVAVASGEPAFGSIPVEQGDVLYLALEDNERRLQKRLSQMGIATPPHRLTLVTQWPDMNNGCVTEIDLWIASVQRPLMIVIDVLNKVRAPSSGREPQYEADYRALTGLHAVAADRGIAIIVLHHTRKQEADDPFDQISGTRGLTGAADTSIVLHKEKGAQHFALYGRGRDIEEIETAVQFEGDTGRWVILGSVYSVAKTTERQAILDALVAAAKPMSPSDVAAVVGKERSNVSHLLSRLVEERRVTKIATGLYIPFTPFTPVTDNE